MCSPLQRMITVCTGNKSFSETIVDPFGPSFQELPENWAGRFAFGR